MDAPHVYVRAWALGCFYSHISTQIFRRALIASVDSCAEIKSAPSVAKLNLAEFAGRCRKAMLGVWLRTPLLAEGCRKPMVECTATAGTPVVIHSYVTHYGVSRTVALRQRMTTFSIIRSARRGVRDGNGVTKETRSEAGKEEGAVKINEKLGLSGDWRAGGGEEGVKLRERERERERE